MKNYTCILQRTETEMRIKSFLTRFDTEYKNSSFNKGLYLYGFPGSGKSYFVTKILKEMDYDIISFDAGHVRNKSLIDAITSNNMSRQNVLNIMYGRTKKIAILMDEVDGMNNGDKGGITSLIKLIRQKKTKKQKLEPVAYNPIICIGNYCIDKKIKELMKVCEVYEIKSPTDAQIDSILREHYPHMRSHSPPHHDLIGMINGDLRKIDSLQKLYLHDPALLRDDVILRKLYSYKRCRHKDTKEITYAIMNTSLAMNTHVDFINETDRTIVGLLYHENIVDDLRDKLLAVLGSDASVVGAVVANFYRFYRKILNNLCFTDYIDRITFQYQIWVFNEMSSLIKTYYNNLLCHAFISEIRTQEQESRSSSSSPQLAAVLVNKTHHNHKTEVRFTKVLTKYSTEYNNQVFLFNLCIALQMDKKDMLAFFQELRIVYGKDMLTNTDKFQEVFGIMEKCNNVSKLDIKRIYRYLDKNIKNEVATPLQITAGAGGEQGDEDATAVALLSSSDGEFDFE